MPHRLCSRQFIVGKIERGGHGRMSKWVPEFGGGRVEGIIPLTLGKPIKFRDLGFPVCKMGARRSLNSPPADSTSNGAFS